MGIFKMSVMNALAGVAVSILISILTALCIVFYLSPLNLVLEVLADPRLASVVIEVTIKNLYILPLCFVLIGICTGQSVVNTTFKGKE